jgi:tetratricopeptide (TPR) repeat protein
MRNLPQPGDHVGRYRIVRELGRGGMAVVMEVVDAESGEHRALKLTLPSVQEEEVARRFRREFRALSRLSHPGVLQVYESGVDEGRLWFVMELLEGRELREEVETWRELAPADRYHRARDILIQLAGALAAIHSRGLVHRDVTPSNVMVLPNGRIKLMDFGVVKEPGGDLTTVGEVVGTVAYISPEQIGGGAVDARADLYSLGSIYYLMLTGRRPFNARTLAGYLDKHLNRPVRPPRELVPTIPADADAICVRLLQKDPADRFSSARHLLHVLHAAGQAPDGSGAAVPTRAGWTPLLVGREAEVATLRGAVVRLAGNNEGPVCGGLVLVEGEPGMGLGRVADEVDNLALRHGLPVSRGDSLDPGQDAYAAFRGLYEDLVRAGGQEPPAVLAATFGDANAEGERIERYAVMAAMGALEGWAAPRVVILEHVERMDRGSRELAEYLIRNRVGEAGGPVLFVLTRSPVEGGEEDPLEKVVSGESTGVPAVRVELGPISAAAVEEMLLGVVDHSEAASALARRLARQGQGNPFLMTEMIHGLLEQGVIEFDGAGGRGRVGLSASEVQELVLPVPRSLQEIIAKRLAPMSPSARAVALALALSRVDLDQGLLREVSGLDEPAVLSALDELIASRLVREVRRGEADRFELDRNRVADVLIGETDSDEVVRLHRRIADGVEARHRRRSDGVVEALAYHYELGRWPAKAVPYLTQAAAKLSQRTFVVEALTKIDRALSLEPEARLYLTLDEADRRLAELLLARAHALVHLGRWTDGWQDAAEAHLLVQELGDPRLLARTHTELATQARRQLELGQASEHLREALAIAERIGDKRLQIEPLYEFGAVRWIQGDLEAARDFFVQAQSSAEAYDDERALALGANGLGLLALCRGQSAEARRCFSRAIEICEATGLMDRLSTARANLIEVYHLTGNLRKGVELADRAVAHAREVRHQHGIGTALRYRVLMLTDLGRYTEAVDNAEEALRIKEELDDRDDVLGVLVVLIRAVLALDDAERAHALLDRAMLLVENYDSEGFLPVLLAWRARLLAEAGEEAEASAILEQVLEAEGRRWPYQQVRLSLNLARVYEVMGDQSEAQDLAQAALGTSDACGFRFYAMRARQLAARVSDDPAGAARHARVAGALARSLAANLPREDRERFLAAQGVRLRGGARPALTGAPSLQPTRSLQPTQSLQPTAAAKPRGADGGDPV